MHAILKNESPVLPRLILVVLLGLLRRHSLFNFSAARGLHASIRDTMAPRLLGDAAEP